MATHCITCYKNMIFDANNNGAIEATTKTLSVYGPLTSAFRTGHKNNDIEFYRFYQKKKGNKNIIKIASV